MTHSIRVTTNNIRGLHLYRKGQAPISNHPIYHTLKPHVIASDIVVLTETKVASNNDDDLNVENFRPFGPKVLVATYSCTGFDDGLMVLFNKETISIISTNVCILIILKNLCFL